MDGEDWFWNSAMTLPPHHDRAIIRLSHGGSDAVVLREWDVAAQLFIEGGFALDERMSEVDWLDRDTLLLMSTLDGDAHVTRCGKARTVRLWRRVSAVEEASVLLSVPFDCHSVKAERDWTVADERIKFNSFIGTFCGYRFVGDRSFSRLVSDIVL